MSKSIWVYADWNTMSEPHLIGVLEVNLVEGNESYRFSYSEAWLNTPYARQTDPSLQLFSVDQVNKNAEHSKTFLDSCPNRWGRRLMEKHEAVLANQEGREISKLNESDYLLRVHDLYRTGGLRFKAEEKGAFLDNNPDLIAPSISDLRELESAVIQVEKQPDLNNPDYIKSLLMLMSSGSSLGGTRPKASITNTDVPWLAKFPSRFDEYDVGAWEYLVYRMAIDAGIQMMPCGVQRFISPHHTFLTQRFDRVGQVRHHFTSAMALLGYYDNDAGASYLELAQFLIEQGANTQADLAQLWRRIVFNILVSNSDDHLRNHGFMLADNNTGWILSPAYDINISLGATGLHLNIDEHSNDLDLNLALAIAPYFQLTPPDAEKIVSDLHNVTRKWKDYACQIGISRPEQQLLESVFH